MDAKVRRNPEIKMAELAYIPIAQITLYISKQP